MYTFKKFNQKTSIWLLNIIIWTVGFATALVFGLLYTLVLLISLFVGIYLSLVNIAVYPLRTYVKKYNPEYKQISNLTLKEKIMSRFSNIFSRSLFPLLSYDEIEKYLDQVIEAKEKYRDKSDEINKDEEQ